MNSREVAIRIRAYCTEHDLAPGDRLPPERALLELLGMTRTELRRGLARLEAEREITREVGRGTFVAGKQTGTGDISPRDVLAVRLLLEPAMMSLVVANATKTDLDRVERCVSAAESAQSQEDFENWDAALHAAIVEATHNALIIDLYSTITAARDSTVWGDLKRASFSADRREVYDSQHRAIVEALVRRDAASAGARVSEHLKQISLNMLGGDPV
jgi:GntR family transcriptional regulator, uxu operon transcriptional repressor